MRLVIDASAGLYVATSARGFGGLEGHDLVAPPLFWSESVSALHQISWRGGLTHGAVTHALEAILLAPIDRVARPTWLAAPGTSPTGLAGQGRMTPSMLPSRRRSGCRS